MLFNNNKNFDSKQRFGIRKLSVGVCSVLLSTLFLTMNSPEVVHASDSDKDIDPNVNEPEIVEVDSAKNSGVNVQKDSATNVSSENADSVSKSNESITRDQSTQNSDVKIKTDTSSAKTEIENTKSNNNQNTAPEGNQSSGASNNAQTTVAAKDNTQTSTPSNDASQATEPVKPASPKADSDAKNGETNTLTIDKNAKAADSKALNESKVNTTDTTVTWSNHRYIMDWDGQAHPASYWDERVTKEVLPWVLKENNNESATFKSMTWTAWMSKDGDNYAPIMNEGPAGNRFGYPHGDLVVTNKNGTSTTTYNDVIINMARSIASYFRSKYGIDDNNNTEQKPVDDENAAKTVINVHANSNSFTGIVPNSSIGKIAVDGWEYVEQGDSAQDSRDYFLSLIKQISLTDADLSKNGQTDAKFAITFTDGSVLKGNKATINVTGGVAQSGLNVAKGANISYAYPNATSGITTDSQNKIAQWTPTYDWVFDANGTPLDASHQYNTNANFDAYVKITYYLNGKNDGSQIVKVPITVNEQTTANSELGKELVAHIDHFISHPISAATGDNNDSTSWKADVDPAGKYNLNQYSWGIDPAQIVWKTGTTDEQKAQYKKIMRSLICTSEHSFPEKNNNGSFSDSTGSGYKVKPGVTLFFTDGSSTTNIPDNYAWIYKPVQVTDSTIKNTFKTGDLSQFDENSAKSHVTNVVPNVNSNNWSFNASYQWVVKDPNGTYTFNNALDMRNTDEWVVWQNSHWAVANPSNSQGKQGVTITGYRALTKDDIKDAGIKHFYVLIGYTKNGNSGSEPGTYDGYYAVPQVIDVKLIGKVDVAKISGDGSQTVTYKGSEYSTSNLDINKFVPTIIDENNGNKINNLTLPDNNNNLKLTNSDYEIQGNPTNAGTYDVYLKTSGIDKIKQWTNADLYDWNGTEADVKVGTFTIEKAKPTVTFNGTGSKTYDGQPLSDTDYTKSIGLTIVAPGTTNPSISLTAGTDYVWKKGLQTYTTAPSDAGTYTIELTTDGINKIKGSSINSANLDWANATIKTDTSYVINQADATVSLNVDDTANGPRYNGLPVSTPLTALKNALRSNGTINGEKLDLTDVIADGFDWYDASGKKLDSAPTDHGVYTIKLNDNGLSQIQTKNPNYKLSIDKNAYLFKIKTARGSVAFSGSHEVAFGTTDSNFSKDYKVELTTNPATIKDFTPSFTLKDGDLEFSTDGNTWSTNVPTTVGTYKVKLTDKARDRIVDDNGKNGNVKWPATNFSGIGSYTVTPAQATASLGGSAKRRYTGSAVTINDINNADSTIGVTINLPNNKTTTYKLIDGDYTWVDGSVPTNVGDYQLKFNLTDKGKKDLQNWLNQTDVAGVGLDKKPNVLAPTEVTGTASFKITPATITVTESGSDSKTYDGDAANVTVTKLTNNNNWSATGMISGQHVNISEDLTLSDFDWYKVNADNSESKLTKAPTDAGNYALKLNADGLKKLQDANKNYSFSAVSGQYTFTINKATATVTFTDNSGQTVDYTGQTGKFDASKFTPTITTAEGIPVPSIPGGINLSLAAGDFTINGVETTTEPTALGDYTIGLSKAGFEKLQSATNNYNWINNAKASYIIQANDKATVTVTNKTDGGQKVVYKGANFGSNDIEVNDYQLTLPTGLSYTLKAGDLEIVPNATGTKDVGTYTVQLSQQGKDNLGAAGGNNFKFDFTKPGVVNTSATFEITKANPTVTFHGEGSKTFAQNDPNWTTNIGLTINAPGATNPTIALANGDYQFVLNSDNSVTSTDIPTNVGEYTIELTEQGKNKIKNAQGTGLNVDNLDWSKANISGTGKFTVKVAEASAKLSGSNSRDYNGSAVTTTDINNGGNIVVSISIPGTDKTVSYTLQDGDYTWTNGTDPINQGSYTLELNKAKVLAHLQDAIKNDSAWNGNVTLADTALSGEATFTIKKVNASAQLQNGASRKYNGSSTSISDVLSQLQNGTNWDASGFVNNEKLDASTLTADGFDWYESDGTTKLTEDPKNVGNYVIKLNSKGISELQNANSNYTFTPNGQFTYEITKANGTVTFNGEHTITYGQSDPDYYKHYSLSFTTDPTISGFTPSYEIKAGDLQFSTDSQSWNDTVPTTKGTYQVRLNPSILANLDNAANIDWSQTGTGTYVINAATATAELSGKNNMTYSGDAVTINDVNGGTIEVTLNFPGVTDTNKVFKLTDASYYTWNTTDHNAPKDVGNYTITLTDVGKTALQKYIDGIAEEGNVTLPSVSGSAEFDINAKAITVTQGRSDQKKYNGQPASANISDVIAGISGSSTVANHPLNVPTTGENALTAADFDWWNGTTDLGKVSENNTAPTNAGSYSIKLNADGLKKLQDANKNYSFNSVGDQYGYTINKATATVSITGTQDSPWTGSSIAIDPTKFPATIKTNNGLNIPNNVTLEAGDYEYVDADGNAIAAPSELGQYKVRLTENGWKKLQSQTDNYTWSYDNSEGTVNINKATATVTLNGSGSVTYTGNTAQIPYDGSYTVTLSNGKTYTLQTGDLEFVDKSVGANTNVGTYQVKLSNEILTHLGAESSVDPIHYTYELTKNNTADLKVTPAEATATIAGNTSEAYKGSSYDVTHGTYNGNYSITWTIGGTPYVLQTGDYNYIDADGNVLNPTKWPVNVGIYKIGLTDQGKKAIEALTKVTGTDVNNYSWKFVNNATFTITAQKMALVVEGSASKNYDGSAAVITQEDLDSGKVTVRWGNSANAPEGVRYTFTPDDFEVVTVDGQPAINSNDKNGDKYYIKLKDSVLNNIKDKNYEFSIGDTNAFYTIHTLSAALSVKGSQTVNYGSPEHLNLTDPNHFWIDFENWKGEGKPNITLQDGDLEIDLDSKPAYTDTNAGLPINVGTYTVKMTDDLINRLKDKYGDNYDFEAEAAQADGSVVVRGGEKKNTKDDVLTKGQDATHNDGVYIVQPLQIKVTIDGTQNVKYGSENYNQNSIINNTGQYSLSYANIASRDKDKFDNFKLTSGDLEFVSTPGNVGQYQVKLTADGIKQLKEIDPDFATNYDWSVNVENARADFNVIQMPVTITVGNAQGTNGQSVVYGQSTTIDNNKYSISVKTEDGKTLDYTLQTGDLQFVTPPTNVGPYKVELSAAGLQKIKDKFGTTNYTYISDGKGDFEVTAATANITLTGNKESTYDGKIPSLNASDYQLTGLPSGVDFKLQDGDLTFVNADGKPLATQPKDASETPYRVGLTQAAKDKLKADEVGKNYEWKLDQSKATYKINKATATVSFKDDQNSQTVNYDGKTDQFDPAKFVPAISTGNEIPTPSVPTDLNLSIDDGDFEFIKDGVSQTTEPTGQGAYTVKLTAKGMQKIYGTNTTNYDWTNSTVGTYTINPISISVSGQGNQDVTYDGTAFGNEDKLDLNKFVPTLNAGTVKVPEISAGTLTADDYTIENSKGETVTDPTNASEYTVWLNENGLNKLKKLSSNFTWPTDSIKVGTLNIAQTDVTAKLSGSNSKTYDGKAVSTTDINEGKKITVKITVNGNTYDYALQDGDYTWNLTDGAPTNVGEYTDKIVLDTTGNLMRHLTEFINSQNKDLEGNFKIDAKNLTGSASFNIDQKNATVTQKGSDSKTYNGTAGSVTLDQLINNLTSNDLVSGQSLKTSGLTLNDFAWSGADPNHIAAGDYTISLTDAGLAKLQKDNPNYKLSVIGSFKYTINQATASAELSGSGQKTYNGDPVSDADIQKSDQDNNITVTVTIPGESTPQTVKLGVNDFTWPDDKVPSAAGTYTITLNANGEKAIKDKFADNKNIDWTKTSFSGSATYTIKKADGKIDFTGSDSKDFDNKEVLPSDLDGNKFYVTINGQQFALPENGYEIVDANGNKVTPKDAGTYYVVLTADGLKDLEKDTNYSWTPNWNGTTRPNQVGTFIINQTKVVPTISGPNDKTYNGLATKLTEVTKDGKIKVSVDSGNTEFTIPNYVLTANDYDWYGADGNKISAPTAVGHYIIKLSTQGLQNIQAYLDKTYGKGNVVVDSTQGSGQANFDINPFEIVVTINGKETVDSGTTTISDGSYSFGFAPTNADDKLPAGWTQPTIPVSDLDFDGQKPTAETKNGTFTVNYKGGQEALQKLLGDNYKVTYVAGKDNYIVSPQAQTGKISYVDQKGNEVGTTPLSGKTGDEVDINPVAPDGWKIVPGQKIPETVTATKDGIPTVIVKVEHKTITVDPTDPKTPDDKLPEKPGKDNPTGDNYPKGVSESDLNKIITRTIEVHLPSGQIERHEQTVHLTRTATIDLVTGEVTYSDWTTGKWDKFIPDTIDGYTVDPTEVPEEDVTSETKDAIVQINYVPIPDQPTQPSDGSGSAPTTKPAGSTPDEKPGDKPEKPTTPEKPSKPNKPNKPGKPSKPSKPEETKPGKNHYTNAALPENGEKGSTNTTSPNGSDVPAGFPAGTHWKHGMLIGPAGEVYYKNGHWTRIGEHALPQTGAHNSMLATVFGSLASGLGILGLLGVHKKKKDEEN